ncbi:MAG: amidohydrolase family protein, partial [Desulfatiglandales bacterium]|nr:amidohydrolase family protein [Desulfatiglandales bacterium]
MEKVNGGMFLMIREGISAKNLEAPLPLLVTLENARRFCLVSDDLHPYDIFKRRHLDFVIKKAIGWDLNHVTAVQMATLNPAEYFGFSERGAIVPGFRSDLVVLGDLGSFAVERGDKGGSLVVEGGEPLDFSFEEEPFIEPRRLNITLFTPESSRIKDQGKKIRIIQLV